VKWIFHRHFWKCICTLNIKDLSTSPISSHSANIFRAWLLWTFLDLFSFVYRMYRHDVALERECYLSQVLWCNEQHGKIPFFTHWSFVSTATCNGRTVDSLFSNGRNIYRQFNTFYCPSYWGLFAFLLILDVLPFSTVILQSIC